MKDDKLLKPKSYQYIWTILKEITVTLWEETRKRGYWKKEEK